MVFKNGERGHQPAWPSRATRFACLNRRTFDSAVRAEYATIAGQGLKLRPTPLANVEELTSISRHLFGGLMLTERARQHRSEFWDALFHDADYPSERRTKKSKRDAEFWQHSRRRRYFNPRSPDPTPRTVYMKSTSTSAASGLTGISPGTSSNEDAAAIEAVLRQYISLLDAGDAASISTEMYKAPILFLSPDGGHTTFLDNEAVCKFLKSYLDAQEKSGRTGTEIEKVQINLLSKSVALALVDYVVKRIDGNTKTGWVYIFQKEAGAWRAASLAPRDVWTTKAR